MTCRLWFGDLGNTVAEDQYAFDWLAVMRKRYPDANVWIEPAPGATPTFPVPEHAESENDNSDFTASATVRCSCCEMVISFPGFSVMLVDTCPHCGEVVNNTPPVI